MKIKYAVLFTCFCTIQVALPHKQQTVRTVGGVQLIAPTYAQPNKNVMPKTLLRNVIMIIDNTEKYVDKTADITMIFDLSIALCQQAAPIVVHGSTLKNLLLFKTSFKDMEKTILPEELPVVKEFYEGKLDNLLKQWDIYESQNDFYLLVPQEYLAQIKKDYAVSDDIALGFDITDAQKFKKIEKDVAKFFIDKQYGTTELHAQALIDLFTKPAQEKIQNYMWNVFLVGHGTYPTDDEDALPYFFADRDYNKKFNISEYYIKIAGFEVFEFKQLVNWLTTMNTNFFAYDSCYAGGFNRLLPYVTQLIYNDAAGKETVIGSIEPNFIIAVASLTDADTDKLLHYGLQCNTHAVAENYLDFNMFFKRLSEETHKFLQEKTKGMSAGFVQKTFKSTPVRLNDEQLKSILKSIYSWCPGEGKVNHPLVMFPHTNTFTLIPLEDDAIVLTRTKIEAALRGSGVIDIKPVRIKGKKELVEPAYIFMPVESIPVTIKITTPEMPQMISLLPGVGLHTIKSIEAPNISYAYFVGALPIIETVFPKYVYIQKLIVEKDHQLEVITGGKGAITLYDVLIVISIDTDSEKMQRMQHVDVFFRTVDNKTYHTLEHYEHPIEKETWFGCPTEEDEKAEEEATEQAESTIRTVAYSLVAGSWTIHDKNPAKNAVMNYIPNQELMKKHLGEFHIEQLMEYLGIWPLPH